MEFRITHGFLAYIQGFQIFTRWRVIHPIVQPPTCAIITGYIPTLLSAATGSFNAAMNYQNSMAHLSSFLQVMKNLKTKRTYVVQKGTLWTNF
jgi:hypothetical protein